MVLIIPSSNALHCTWPMKLSLDLASITIQPSTALHESHTHRRFIQPCVSKYGQTANGVVFEYFKEQSWKSEELRIVQPASAI